MLTVGVRKAVVPCLMSVVLSGTALSSAAAQLQSVPTLGSVAMHLGDPRDEVLARLRARYDLRQGEGDVWSVSDTTRWSNGPNYGNVGFVQFVSGRVSTVNRTWSPAQDNTRDVAAILEALSQLDGSSNCFVRKQAWTDPAFSMMSIEVRCGPHSVSISESQRGNRGVQVAENWYISR
jgi:hypothetical protein